MRTLAIFVSRTDQYPRKATCSKQRIGLEKTLNKCDKNNHAHTVLSSCPDFQESQVNCSTYAKVELRNQFSRINGCLGTELCATKAIKRIERELGEGQHVLRHGFSNVLEAK